MSKIAAIGPDKLFGGFKAFGIDVFDAASSDEARKSLDDINRSKKHNIIFVLEKYAADFPDLVETISKKTTPSLVVLPGVGEEIGYGVDRMRALIRKASGQNLI